MLRALPVALLAAWIPGDGSRPDWPAAEGRQQPAVEDDLWCRRSGFAPGSEAYAICRFRIDAARKDGMTICRLSQGSVRCL